MKKTRKTTTKGLSLEEAMKLADAAPPLSAKELRYLRSAKAGPDADRDVGAPPRRGRPPRDEPAAQVVGKTVKHTPAFWRALAKTAADEGLTVHEAMRRALVEWVERKAG